MKLIETTSAFELFSSWFGSISPLSGSSLAKFAAVLYEREVKKGEILLREGQVSREFYFISRGSLRSYALEDKKEERKKKNHEKDFAADFESYRFETSSKY